MSLAMCWRRLPARLVMSDIAGDVPGQASTAGMAISDIASDVPWHVSTAVVAISDVASDALGQVLVLEDCDQRCRQRCPGAGLCGKGSDQRYR